MESSNLILLAETALAESAPMTKLSPITHKSKRRPKMMHIFQLYGLATPSSAQPPRPLLKTKLSPITHKSKRRPKMMHMFQLYGLATPSTSTQPGRAAMQS